MPFEGFGEVNRIEDKTDNKKEEPRPEEHDNSLPLFENVEERELYENILDLKERVPEVLLI